MHGLEIRRRVRLLVCSILLLFSTLVDAQEQEGAPPSFRAGVTRVEVSAVVVDADGRPVRDLTVDEVQLFEGGRRQEIRTFTPVRLASELQNQQDVRASTDATATNGDRSTSRLVALLIDDLHIDAGHTSRARSLARQVLEQLGPSDLLYVGLTSDTLQSTGVFTTARLRARDVIDRFSGMRLPSAADVRRDTPDLPMTQPPRMLGSDMGLSADLQQHGTRLAQTFSAIGELAEGLVDAPGRRKTLILLTEGPAAPIREDQGTGPEAAAAMRQALALAAFADLAVYPLSPSGLDSPTDGMIEGFTRAVDSTGREVAHEDLSAAIGDFLAGKALLRDVAALTGGRALTDRNDGAQAITEALREASDYYVLSYEQNRDVHSGISPIDVRVSRPGVRVRTRRGRAGGSAVAAAMSSDTTDTLARLLRSLGVDDGLPVKLRAFRVSDTEDLVRYAIAAEVSGGPLVAGIADDRLVVEQALVTMDANGGLGPAIRRSAELRLPQGQVQILQSSSLRTVWVVDLPPGLHQVRVATLQPTTGLRGLAALDLDVAPALPEEVSAFVTAMRRSLPTAFVDPRLQPFLPSIVAPVRDATPEDTRSSSGPWATALQAYQRGEYGNVATQVTSVDDAALKDEVTHAFRRLRVEPNREEAARHLSGSAAMALELALVHLQTADGTKASAYLRIAEEARNALARTRAASQQFTAQWDLARLHVLLLARDFTNVIRAGASIPAEGLTPGLRAEWYIARGLAREAQSRQALWDRPTNTQVTALAPTNFDRELWIANERQVAIAEYRRALEEMPTHPEAQVRLGRMLFESGQPDEARTLLTAAASRDCPTMLCGLAWLFLGDWYAKYGEAEEAREAYLQASRVLDVRQSALVALLRLTLRMSPASASELARQFDASSMLSRQQTPDAWSRYLSSSPLGLSTVIGALREGVRE